MGWLQHCLHNYNDYKTWEIQMHKMHKQREWIIWCFYLLHKVLEMWPLLTLNWRCFVTDSTITLIYIITCTNIVTCIITYINIIAYIIICINIVTYIITCIIVNFQSTLSLLLVIKLFKKRPWSMLTWKPSWKLPWSDSLIGYNLN